jgi:hypothetical protein
MFLLLLVCGGMLANGDIGFYTNYNVMWGFDHALPMDEGRQMQIYMDKYSGYLHLPSSSFSSSSSGYLSPFFLLFLCFCFK